MIQRTYLYCERREAFGVGVWMEFSPEPCVPSLCCRKSAQVLLNSILVIALIRQIPGIFAAPLPLSLPDSANHGPSYLTAGVDIGDIFFYTKGNTFFCQRILACVGAYTHTRRHADTGLPTTSWSLAPLSFYGDRPQEPGPCLCICVFHAR